MKGIIAKLEEVGTAELKLSFYDAVTSGASDKWQGQALFTEKTYSAAELQELNLSPAQYAEIGENLVVRLLALNGKIK